MMKLYREYEDLMIKIMMILSAIILVVLLIVVLAKFALKLLLTGVIISAILLGAGAIYLGVCLIIDFDQKFGIKR